MSSIRRPGPQLLCVFGAVRTLGTKNVAARGRSGCMRVLDGRLTPGGSYRTWVYDLSGPAGRARRKAGGRFAAIQEPLADPVGYYRGVATMQPLGIRCGAAHKRPHAVLLAFDAHGMTNRPWPAVCTVCASGPCRMCRLAGTCHVLLPPPAGGTRRRTTHPGPDTRRRLP